MLVKVTPHIVTIIKGQTEPINEKEINVSKCTFEFEDIEENCVKEAYFTLNGNTYKQILVNNECDYPSEILEQKGELEIGVVAFLVENNEEIKRYNPTPDYYSTWKGSLKDAENSEPITPTDKEQIEQMLSNINMTITKDGRITTITFTNKDGITQTETLEDGKSLEFNWDGTSLGVRQEGQSNYQYVNLQGPQGPAGAIKFEIVQTLPTENIKTDTIYLVPIEEPETGNNYDEYIYTNGQWEKLGGIQVEVDLTDYVKNTDYASASKGGVVKVSSSYGTEMTSGGYLKGTGRLYSQYTNDDLGLIISKYTLENVITGKGLVSNTDYATSSTGGVVKVGGVGGLATTSGFLIANTKTYEEYSSLDNRYVIGKGTLENVLTARIGDIQTLLDNLNNGGGVQ